MTKATAVIFRAERSGDHKGEVTAVFPTKPADHRGNSMEAFAHIGQHCSATIEWYYTTRPATPAEYATLKAELEAEPYGYKLAVFKRMTSFHREAYSAALEDDA